MANYSVMIALDGTCSVRLSEEVTYVNPFYEDVDEYDVDEFDSEDIKDVARAIVEHNIYHEVKVVTTFTEEEINQAIIHYLQYGLEEV